MSQWNSLTATGAVQSSATIPAVRDLNGSFEWVVKVQGTTLTTTPSDTITLASIGSGGAGSNEKARIEFTPYGTSPTTGQLRVWIYEVSDSEYNATLEFDPTALTAADQHRIVVRHTDGDPSSTTIVLYNAAGTQVATATAGGFFAQDLPVTTGSGIIYIGPAINSTSLRVDAFTIRTTVGSGAPADPVDETDLICYYGFPTGTETASSIGGDPALTLAGTEDTDYEFVAGEWPTASSSSIVPIAMNHYRKRRS